MKPWRRPAHRIRIYAAKMPYAGWLWYATCKCGWQHANSSFMTGGLWGRPTWDSALALGTGHLRQECKHA